MCLQDLAHWGTIVAGFSAFFFGILTIIFLFIAFTKQTEANNLIRKSQKKQTESQIIQWVDSDLGRISDLIEKLKYTPINANHHSVNEITVHTDRHSIQAYANEFKVISDHTGLLNSDYFQDLYFLIAEFDSLLFLVKKVGLKKKIRKELIRKITLLYNNKIRRPFDVLETLYLENKIITTEDDSKFNSKKLLNLTLKTHKMYKNTTEEYDV